MVRNLVVATLLLASAACVGRKAEAPAFKDEHPLPEDPLVVKAKSIGTYGGRFIIAVTSGPRTFNHMMANETSSVDITNLMFMGLTHFDNERQEIIPMLAKSWEMSSDGLTWTFHMRRGAAFSDGHPITADDILFGFQLSYDETLHPSIQDLLIMNGKKWDVTAPDPYTIVVKTPVPNAMVPTLIGDVRAMPKHILEAAFKSGDFGSTYSVSTPPDQIVTSGAWRVGQYVAGEKTVLTRNPYSFKVDDKQQRLPYLDELVYLIVPDQDAMDLKFRAGGVDGLDNPKPENYSYYAENQKAGNYTLNDLGPALSSNFFWFNLNRVRKATPGKKVGDTYLDAARYALFNNPVFRRAVSMAVDRDAMIPSIFFGEGVKNWSMATPGNKIWYSADVVKYDYNVQESKKLLVELGLTDKNGDGFLDDAAGNPVGFTIKTNSDNRIRVAMANFIRDDLAKVGIKVTLVPVDFNTLVTNIREDKQYEAVLLGIQQGVPPDPAMGQNVYRSSGLTHYWNLTQPKPETPQEARIDQLMDLFISTPDLDKRLDAWKEIQNIINEQCWLVWLPTIKIKLPLSNRFGNTSPSPISHRLLWNSESLFVKPAAQPSAY